MNAVAATGDWKRVNRLPRRRVSERDGEAKAKFWTRELRVRGSKRAFNAWQGLSIAEVVENNGGYLALPVGKGKTDITYALPVALGVDRAVLILPSNGGRGLREKTYAEFNELARHWQSPRVPTTVITASTLASASNADLLGKTIKPKLLMIDECDDLANWDSAAVVRLDRYIQDNPDVIVVCLTGTPGRLSIMNYWHHLVWCLRDRAPVPLNRAEAEKWAQAIDEKKDRDGYRKIQPGVMGGTLEAARAWYLKRLSETPGVVIVDGDSAAGVPLSIEVRLAREDAALDREFKLFLRGDLANGRAPLVTPGGQSVSDPLSRYRLDAQLGCGFFTYYDPPPPRPWREAMLAKNRFVRRKILASRRSWQPIETEAQVFRRFPDDPVIRRWQKVRDTFDAEKHTKTAWVSDSAIQSVRAWLAESPDPGIVWCGATEFAEALTKATRLPYYGPRGVDQSGRSLHAADPKRSMVCSWHANKRGFNLQAWRRMLIVMPPQSAKYLEQIFGRAHRQGQTKGVAVFVLATSGGTLDAFERAIEEARFARDTVGMTQKILRAKIRRARPRVTSGNKYRWTRKEAA